MIFIKNKIPGILAILIFTGAATSVGITGTDDDGHHMLIAKISFFAGLTISAIFVYSFKGDIVGPVKTDEDINTSYVDKPIMLIILALCSFILMIKVMVLN